MRRIVLAGHQEVDEPYRFNVHRPCKVRTLVPVLDPSEAKSASIVWKSEVKGVEDVGEDRVSRVRQSFFQHQCKLAVVNAGKVAAIFEYKEYRLIDFDSIHRLQIKS